MKILFYINIFFISTSLLSQSTKSPFVNLSPNDQDLIFDHIKERDGLSYNFVSDIVQDDAGMLWISTYSGLNRYDGKRFEVFKKTEKDSATIISNYITQLCKDKEGNIWGSTPVGLLCYDAKEKHFKRYYNGDLIYSPGLNGVYCDLLDQIWAGSYNGLQRLDKSTGKFIQYMPISNDKFSITSKVIQKNGITADPNGRGLWIATPEGLNYFDNKTTRFENYQNSSLDKIFNKNSIGTLFLSKEGILWILDETSKEIIGIKNRKILTRIDLKGVINDATEGMIYETSDHKLWYSSIRYETILIDYKNDNQITKYKYDITNPGSISGDQVCAAWEDMDNTVWFATPNGISKYNPKNHFYNMIKLEKLFPDLDKNWNITCLAEDKMTGDVWIGSRDGIAYVYSAKKNTIEKIDFKKYRHKEQKSYFITSINFINGKAIIFFYNDYTFQYDLNNQKYELFYGLNGKYKEFKARAMHKETDSTYILGNNFTPALRWNVYNNELEEINFDVPENINGAKYMTGWMKPSVGKGSWLFSQTTSLGYIAVGSTRIQNFDLDINMIRGSFINALEPDKNGNVWISFFGQGLINVIKKNKTVLDKEDLVFKKWDSSDGLINEIVLSAVTDKNGHIWSASYNKFSVFNPELNKFTNFEIKLQEQSSFYYNYMIALSNGNILTNIKGSLIEFFPDKLKKAFPQNELLISKIGLQDKSIYLSNESMVFLKPNENFINIAFGCLSNEKVYGYHFEYKLDGINKDWVKSINKSEATYSDLSPGTYLFHLKAISPDKNWVSEEKLLTIIIEAPFYKTWWFILCVISLLIYLIYSQVQGRIKRIRDMNLLKSKAYLLEKEKTEVMYENLKQHLNPHFLFNSLTSLSSLIRVDQNQAGNFLDQMSKIYRYILKNKDTETVPLFEELKFILLYIQLQKTRFGDGLEIEINVPEELYDRRIAPVTLQNLVENAIKHNIANGGTPLSIQIFIEKDYLIVQNNLNKKNFVETSNKQGQISMVALYRFLSSLPVIIQEDEKHYTVKIPLLS